LTIEKDGVVKKYWQNLSATWVVCRPTFTCGQVTDFAEQKVEHIEIARCHVIGNTGRVFNSNIFFD